MGSTRRKTLTEIKIIARDRGGRLLSNSYKNNRQKLKWECANNHTWYATFHDVSSSNSWCPKCSGKARLTISELKKIAKSKGGELLSKKIINSKTKLKWKCADGHTWQAQPTCIKNQGEWCPYCNSFPNEEKCRYILEFLLQTPFKKNRTFIGSRIELDGYSKKHDLAFEFQGIQHYEYKRYFHKDSTVFKRNQERDKEKERLCQESGIKLIVIPYFVTYQKGSLPEYIAAKLKELKIPLKKKLKDFSFRGFQKHISELNTLNRIAKQRGGKLLSQEYLGLHSKLQWQCGKGHKWFATPSNVKNNKSWCLKCSGSEKKTILQMQTIAKSKGGKCLSDKYINSHTKLLWECKKGHQFSASALHVINSKSWCRECSGTKPLTIEEMQTIALRRGGKCLSPEYKNCNTKLLWQCDAGHTWLATPLSVKHGKTWCLTCFRIRTASSKR